MSRYTLDPQNTEIRTYLKKNNVNTQILNKIFERYETVPPTYSVSVLRRKIKLVSNEKIMAF